MNTLKRNRGAGAWCFLSLSLREKTVAIIASTLCFLIVGLYFLTSLVVRIGFINVENELYQGFGEVERQDTITNVSRVVNAIDTRIENLAVKFADWARWDDTYAFIVDNNAQYRESNLYENALGVLKVNLLMMIDASGRVVYADAFDLDKGRSAAIPTSLSAYTGHSGSLVQYSSNEDVKQGLLLLPEGPLMVVSRPIIKSDGTGVIRGAFIVGIFINKSEIQHLSKLTRLNIKCHRANAADIPDDISAGVAMLSKATPIAVLPSSLDVISGYTVLNDMSANKAILLKVDIPRNIHRQAESTLVSIKAHGRSILVALVLSIFFSGLMLGGAILFLLERSVISRLAKLSGRTNAIGESGDFAARVLVEGNDEISSLSRSVNVMLETLSHSHQQITDNIEYAKRIQSSLLPTPEVILACLGEAMVIWQPKAIVSGDLFFIHHEGNGFLVVLMDCTGHGVSGAFMTLIAHSALRTIVEDQGCLQPAQILHRLNAALKTTLYQVDHHAASDDGLDAAVCHFERGSRVLTFAGAKRPLVWITAEGLNTIEGDRQSIGYVGVDIDAVYTEHRIELGNLATIYLFSDGYADQIGGKGFPFGRKHFYHLLKEHATLSLPEQERVLLSAFDTYRGEREIYDDITVIGFRP